MKRLNAIIILAVLALINASYLTRKAFEIKNGDISQWFCDLNGQISCTNALSAPEARIGGSIPFPMIALVVYPLIIALAARGLYSKKTTKAANILTYISGAGIIFNGYFIMTEAIIIKAFCPLCLLCTWIIIAIFFLSLKERE